jgi:hypothetical protein
LVVFCGTKERAKSMLDSLAQSRKKAHREWPVFLLSDSSRPMSGIPDDVAVLVTSPVPDFSTPANEDQRRVVQAAVYAGGNSYEVFAYDAVMLLSKAITEIRDRGLAVNRATLANTLSHVRQFRAGFKYLFVDGENTHPDYFVFSAGPSLPRGKACGDDGGRSAWRIPGQAGQGVLVYDCAIAPDALAELASNER